MVTHSGVSFVGGTPNLPPTAQGPKDADEERIWKQRFFNDVERAGTPPSPIEIFNSDVAFYGRPNTGKRNWFSNQFHNHAKKPEHLRKYHFLLKKLNIQPSQSTKNRVMAANSTNEESRTPLMTQQRPWAPDSFTTAINKTNGSAFDIGSSASLTVSAAYFNFRAHFNGSSPLRPDLIFVEKGQTCYGTAPFKIVWNSVIKKNGRKVQGYTIWFLGEKDQIRRCIQMVPDGIPMVCMPYKGSIVSVKVPTFSHSYKNMIDNVIKKSTTYEQDPDSYETLLATKLRVEEDPELQWSYYYLLFPMNQKLDNRILSEKDNEGKHLDLEVLPNGYQDKEEGIFFFSGVCKSRIAVSEYFSPTEAPPHFAC
ncbi:unnamed protein product [Cylindrotheca closterium]|uniref:Uncharacterized protein n=1 Tax=Cylindrotheca closterium TaxID=2856 RepID=A0AAD2GAB2_9STRA|nr:unnamed protein product [Cylindrotheca closterium]